MNNNNVLKKITIAQSIKQFECKDIFALGGLVCSSSQIKAFMAGSQNKNYVKLSDEQLENFFNGLIIYMRGERNEPGIIPQGIENYILELMKSGQGDTLDELRCLVEDAKDGIVSACDDSDKK
ncbi:MAG: DUF1456 family protein [Mariprofundaceae bacterium]